MWIPVVVGVVAIALPALWGTVQVQQYAVASRVNIFAIYVNSPLVLVVPFLATWAGNARLHAELGNRHVVNLRTRISTRSFLRARLLRSVLVPGIIFAASVVSVYLIAFVLWPRLGDPFIDPSVNFLTTAAAVAAYEQSFAGFTQLMAIGSPAFGLTYALWFGFGAGVYGALAAAALILIPNRSVAILLPMGIYIAETIAAAILISPFAGLLYSLSPVGLQQKSILLTVAPTLVLAIIVTLIWVWIFGRSNDLPSLRR